MFNPARAEGLTFEIGGPHKVHLRMRPMHPDSDPFGHRQGIECKITASFVATKFLMDFVGAIIERRFTTYEGMPIKLPHVKDGREEIYADGSFREGYVLPFEGYPLPLRDLCDEAEQLLLDAGTRFLKLIVWSLDIYARTDMIQHHCLYWRVVEGNFYAVGPKGQIITASGDGGGSVTWDPTDEVRLKTLWNADHNEPLAYELLREAKNLIVSAPRSALLILATALEVGVKAYIAKVAPQTEWLVENLPSPPVYKLFRDYLPFLQATPIDDLRDWTKLRPLFKDCQKLFESRNDLTHAGATDINAEKLDAYFATAHDLLRILDVLQGHEWAKGYVSYKICQDLSWPPPRRPNSSAIFMSHLL